MYEKPQYLTPSGYKRLARNPATGASVGIARRKSAPLKASQARVPIRKASGISDEAAALVANALKVMLHG